MNNSVPAWFKQHQLISFFVLTYLIAFGVMFPFIYFNPSKPLMPWSLIWFLYAFSPSISASIITLIIGGMSGIKRLFSGFSRWKAGIYWYFWAAFIILGPLVITLTYKALGKPAAGIMPGETLASLLEGDLSLCSSQVRSLKKWAGADLPFRGCR